MKTKEIEYEGIKYIIKELTFEDGFDELTPEERLSKKKADNAADFVSKCLLEPKLSSEEVKKLPLALGSKLLSIVNELNGFNRQDFPHSEVNKEEDGK